MYEYTTNITSTEKKQQPETKRHFSVLPGSGPWSFISIWWIDGSSTRWMSITRLRLQYFLVTWGRFFQNRLKFKIVMVFGICIFVLICSSTSMDLCIVDLYGFVMFVWEWVRLLHVFVIHHNQRFASPFLLKTSEVLHLWQRHHQLCLQTQHEHGPTNAILLPVVLPQHFESQMPSLETKSDRFGPK